MFLELDVWVYSSFDLSSTTGFKFNSLRASLLTVLRVVNAVVRLNSSGKTMVSILHVDLTSCRYCKVLVSYQTKMSRINEDF